MGMFDYIRYKGHEYQSKDTPNQWMDNYEIRDDGTLWVEDYDSEWVADSEGLFGGFLEKKNVRDRFVFEFIGEIRFYRDIDYKKDLWEEFSAYFVNGQMKFITEIKK
jgi:hypothetical protein